MRRGNEPTVAFGREVAVEPCTQSTPTIGMAVATLATLVVATIFSYVDRSILGLLAAPIQHGLAISDFQLSLVLGPTFAVFYALMGWPLGWLSDRSNRLRLAAAGIALWSVMTALSGLSHEYWQLLLGRIGVAVGEAVLLPTATSLVTDSFPPRLRTRMVGVLGMSIYWGTGLAFLLGGLLINHVGHLADANALPEGLKAWQAVMILVGAPGLLVALVLLVLPEPGRHASASQRVLASSTPTTPEVRATKEYAFLFVASGLMAVVSYSVVSWAPSHLVRTYGWSAGMAGVRLGACFLVATTAIIYLATYAADRLAAKGNRDGKYVVAGCCTLAALPCAVAVGFVHDTTVFVVAASLAVGSAAACIAIAPAAVADITLAARRGRAMGAYQMVVGIIGGGLGPPAVALLGKFGVGGPGGLGSALSLVASAGFLIATVIFWTRRPAFSRTSLAVSEADRA